MLHDAPTEAERAELEHYLRNSSVDDPVVIRAGWGNHVSYTAARIIGVNARSGRVYTDRSGAGASQGTAFYMRSGRDCDQPKGQTWLIMPTDENLRLTATGLKGAHYRGPKLPD